MLAVKKEERYYNVLGATHNNNRIAFEAETVTVADALALAERLCERVRSGTVVFDGQVLPLTVTIGVAAWAGEGDSLASLLGRADAALYRAKAQGRNRVCADESGVVLPFPDRPRAG